VTDEVWRPLGYESEDADAYDALHDGVPNWMAESFWGWIKAQMTARARGSGYGDRPESGFAGP